MKIRVFVAILLLSSTLSLTLGARPVHAASSSNTVIATVNVGNSPHGLAFDPVNSKMYVANTDSNTTSLVDSLTNMVTATIPVGTGPVAAAFDPATNNMYVADFGRFISPSAGFFLGENVSVIDSTSNAVIATIKVGSTPEDVAYDPANHDMYVTNGGTVPVIDGSTNTVIANVNAGRGPFGVADDPVNNDIYVTNIASDNVSVVDSSTNKVVTTIAVGHEPFFDAYDPANHDMYVVNHVAGTISVIDSLTNLVVATVSFPTLSLEGLAFNPINNDMYVTNPTTNTVFVIDSATNTIVDTITVGNAPVFVAFDPANDDMYVANSNSNTISVVSTATPAQATQNLINTINGMSLPVGVRTSLRAPLSQSITLLGAGKSIPVCNLLNAFISKVNDDLAAGLLTSSQANQLIQQANAIRTSLACA